MHIHRLDSLANIKLTVKVHSSMQNGGKNAITEEDAHSLVGQLC